MPSYNHGHLIKEGVKSVISQTYSNWELIIIDNNSDDETDEVLGLFSDERIRVKKINNNGIIGVSRNIGIEMATGDWIAFLDSDDIWYRSRLQKVVEEIATHGEVDLISTDEIIVNKLNGKRRLVRYGSYSEDYYKNFLLKGNSLSPSATMVKAIFIQNNNIGFSENPGYVTAEDYDFWLKILYAGAKLIYINQALGESIVHSHSTSLQSDNHKINSMNVVRHHVFNVQDFYENKNKLWKIICAGIILSDAKIKFCEKYYIKSLNLICKAFNESITGCFNYFSTKAIKFLRKTFQLFY